MSTHDDAADFTLASDATLAPDGSTTTGRSPAPPRRGSTLGRYIILRQIGAGAMGTVYEAFDPELERKVALKLMRAGVRSGEALSQGSARMLREARAMAKLVHPHVITVFDVGTVDAQIFVAMELIDGSTLTEWLRQPGRSISEILRVFRAAGAGLAAAHAGGLVHRDFKPDNVLVGNDGRVVVLDFGLATAAGVDSSGASASADPEASSSGWQSQLTATGAVMGTPAYMAPEQHAGRHVDARADQFAFCVGLYEALCGERPFDGANLPALAAAVIAGKVRPIPAKARMPRWVSRIVLRGLQADPDARWPSMDALLAELSRDPIRRRRTLMLATAGLVVLATGVTSRWLSEQRRVLACADNASELSGIWDDAQRVSAREAFIALAGEYGAERFERTDRRLEEYRSNWLDTDRRACVEERPFLELQRLCLDEARAQMQALSGLVQEPTLDIVNASARVVIALPDIDQCDAHGDLVQRFPIPPSADERLAISAVRRTLGHAHVLSYVPMVDETLTLTRSALARAQAIGYEPLVAEALEMHAGALSEAGELAEAEATYWSAIAAAQRARHQRVAAEAWAQLVFNIGVNRARPEEVLRWLPVAESAVRVADSPGLTAMLEANVGAVYFERREYEKAQERFATGLRIAEDRHGPDGLMIVNYLNNMGAVRGALGDLPGSRAYLQRGLTIRETQLGPEHPSVADVLHNLAVTDARLERIDQAQASCERALKIRERALPADHRDIGISLFLLGQIATAEDRHAEAIGHLERALAIQLRSFHDDHPEVVTTREALAEARRNLEHGDAADD